MKNKIVCKDLKFNMKKKNILKICSLIVILTWMIIIFCFSNKPSVDSKRESGKVIEVIINKLPDTKDLSQSEKIELIKELQPMVRKMAHFILYITGGIIIFIVVSMYVKAYKNLIYSICIGGIYAITDEIHQIFVIGRSCELRDVLIDTSGIVVGILICCIYDYFNSEKVMNKYKFTKNT